MLDGHNGMGHVIAKRAKQMAIDKARRFGMGMVAVRNSTHYGIAGYYVLAACDDGMIGITGTNARPSIAPTFGVENMLGTNPLTFGCPPTRHSRSCSTAPPPSPSAARSRSTPATGKELPPGWVIDHDGHTRTDSQKVLADLVAGTAALTPLGGLGEETAGYKGYGYATVVEILSAALQQGAFLKDCSASRTARRSPTTSATSSSPSTSSTSCRSPLQENRRRHLPPAPGLPEGPRRRAHLHRRREGAPHLARQPRPGRAGQREPAQGDRPHARGAGPGPLPLPVGLR